MTALERVKQELGWWIDDGRIMTPDGVKHFGVLPVERWTFNFCLRLAEENERLATELQARRAAEREESKTDGGKG